jgi:CO/xanthine dehydrogenase FAD-binding subunit
MMRPAEVSYVRALDLEDAGRQRADLELACTQITQQRLTPANHMHEGDRLEIGAVTNLAQVAADETVRAVMPALAEGARRVGDAQIRSWGTSMPMRTIASLSFR